MATNPQAELQSFTLFPYLPLELRLKVWAYMIPPRIVTLHSQGGKDKPRLRKNNKAMYCSKAMRWTSPNPVPTILHICHESREEALKSYQRLFKPNDFQAGIYFDFSRDTLRIGITRPEYYLTEGASWFSTGRDPCMEDHTAIVDWPENHEINIAENLQFMITEDDDFSPSIWHQIRRFPALRADCHALGELRLNGSVDEAAQSVDSIHRSKISGMVGPENHSDFSRFWDRVGDFDSSK